MKEFLKTILKKAGVQVKRYPDEDLARRLKIIKTYKIDTLFDVGANAGQYASSMREMGYSGNIISFEPLNAAFQKLSENAAKDLKWSVHNYALGDTETTSTIHVAANSYSSSILNMLPKHEASAPASKYISSEEIKVKTLDKVFHELRGNGKQVMVKIDTQGYEKNVVEGATNTLKDISILQLEMSLAPLYENEMLFPEMLSYILNKGFTLQSLENGFADPATGQLLQVDGVFLRKDLVN